MLRNPAQCGHYDLHYMQDAANSSEEMAIQYHSIFIHGGEEMNPLLAIPVTTSGGAIQLSLQAWLSNPDNAATTAFLPDNRKCSLAGCRDQQDGTGQTAVG